ncbi:MAG: hypothetical protein V4487_01830 [Chlamydiota bacterium]
MKFLTSQFLAFIICFVNILASAALHGEGISRVDSEKIYIDPLDVAIVGKEIMICLNNEWIPSSAVRSDARGLYLEWSDYLRWLCPRCRWNNDPQNDFCEKCKLPRPAGK